MSPISVKQIEKARLFSGLHMKHDPLILFNVWDAGSAMAIEKSGGKALATGSWSVAAAQGFRDGEQLPLELLLTIVERITASVSLPVSVDFEGAYAIQPDDVAKNVRRLISSGVIGCNFEDQIVGGRGLFPIETQVERIRAMRETAEMLGIPFFINARTDLFLQQQNAELHTALLPEAKDRAAAYCEAGASGFFVPGLVDTALIREICEISPLPVNVMKTKTVGTNTELAALGVARISHGPGPYRQSIENLASAHKSALGM